MERPSPTSNTEIYLGAGDLARLAGVSRQEVHFCWQAGELPIDARTAAGVRLVRPETAAQWAAARRQERPRG